MAHVDDRVTFHALGDPMPAQRPSGLRDRGAVVGDRGPLLAEHDANADGIAGPVLQLAVNHGVGTGGSAPVPLRCLALLVPEVHLDKTVALRDSFRGDDSSFPGLADVAGSVAEVGWASWAEELPYRPSRVLVTGTSGSGKSTLARRVAAALDAPYTELDALHHGPAWVPRPEFLDEVRRLAAAERWTTEWQYPAARPILATRADLLIFLDLPRWLVMTRVVRRTLWRRFRRVELWNGNFEPRLRAVLHDREHIVRWAWQTHNEHLGHVTELIEQLPELPVIRLQTRRQIDRWRAGPLARAARLSGRGGA